MKKNIIIGIQTFLILILSIFLYFMIYPINFPRYDPSALIRFIEDEKLTPGINVKKIPIVKESEVFYLENGSLLAVYETEGLEVGLYVKNDSIHSAYIIQGRSKKWLFLEHESMQ